MIFNAVGGGAGFPHTLRSRPTGPAVGFATTLLLRLQMAFPTFAEAQLLEAMGPHVEAVKAQAEESRTKRPRT